MKNKTLATLLALTLGGLGVHRFYLGQRKAWWYLGFCWTFIPMIVGWVDALTFFSMSYATFNRLYNLKNDFRKIFADDTELHQACTESEREEQLIAILEELSSREKIEEFLQASKQKGDYLPRAVYARARALMENRTLDNA